MKRQAQTLAQWKQARLYPFEVWAQAEGMTERGSVPVDITEHYNRKHATKRRFSLPTTPPPKRNNTIE